MIFERYSKVTQGFDEFVYDRLKQKAKKDNNKNLEQEAERFKYHANLSREVAKLKEQHPDIKKVNAFFYPKEIADNAGSYKNKELLSGGIPINLYLYRDGSDWVLKDLTDPNPQEIKTNKESGSITELFEELDSKYRFPEGLLLWNIPELNKNGTTIITGNTTLAEWFTYVGLGLGAAMLAAATFGASVPATLVVISSAVVVTGSVLSLIEKGEQGMLETKDVVVELANIVGSLSVGLAAGLKMTIKGTSLAKLPAFAGKSEVICVNLLKTGAAADAGSLILMDEVALEQ